MRYFLLASGLPQRIIDLGHLGPCRLPFLQMSPHVTLFPFQHAVNRIAAASMIQVGCLARDDVGMDMRHALPGIRPVLHGDIQAGAMEQSLDDLPDPLYGQVQVGDFIVGQIGQAGNDPPGRNENMAGQKRLQVDKGKAQGCEMEYLLLGLASRLQCLEDWWYVHGW